MDIVILWTIIIGFIVGVVAKFIMPGDKSEPTGFILDDGLGDCRRVRRDLARSGRGLV